jgi:RES domain
VRGVGLWRTLRNARVLDLRILPSVPGTFSNADRDTTLGTRFLRHFTRAIMSPVARDQRVHVDYLPSQVVTEYLKDFEFKGFKGGRIDGIAYGSTVDNRGWNLALFADQSSLCLSRPKESGQWLQFVRTTHVKLRL